MAGFWRKGNFNNPVRTGRQPTIRPNEVRPQSSGSEASHCPRLTRGGLAGDDPEEFGLVFEDLHAQ